MRPKLLYKNARRLKGIPEIARWATVYFTEVENSFIIKDLGLWNKKNVCSNLTSAT